MTTSHSQLPTPTPPPPPPPSSTPSSHPCQHHHQSIHQDPLNLNLIEPHSNSLLISTSISSSPSKLFHQATSSTKHQSLLSSVSHETQITRLPTHFYHHQHQPDHHRHSSNSSISSDSSSISTIRSPLMALPSPALTNPLLIPINLGLPSNMFKKTHSSDHQTNPQTTNPDRLDSLDFFSISNTRNSNSIKSKVSSQNKTSGFFATPFNTVLPPPRLTSSQPYSNSTKISPTHQHRLSNIFDSPSSSCNPTPSTSPPSLHHPNLSSPPINNSNTKCSLDGPTPLSISTPSRSVSCPHQSHLSRIPSIKRLNEINQIIPEVSCDKLYTPLKHSMLKPSINPENSNSSDQDPDSSPNKHLEPPSRHPTFVANHHTLSRLSILSSTSSVSSTPTLTSASQEQPHSSTRSSTDTSSQLLDPVTGIVYQITRTLGEGSFSKVVEAKHGTNHQLVALKMIANDAVDQNERMKSSVGREIGVLQHIRHPLLVGMSAAFETVDTLHTVLVLEHVGGGELFDLVGRAHACFTNEFVRRTMGELIAAIGWMHQLGLVHRDIKLENILLTRPLFVNGSSELPLRSEPMIKLTDFGLSRFIDLEGSLLSTRCGSEEYAAPELILGKAYDGRKTDVWALGVVGYGIIVGRLPFGGSSRRQMLVKIAKGSYDWPSASSEGESEGEGVKMKGEEEIKRVVEKMLVRESERRIQIDEIEGFHEFKERWNSAGVGRRPIEGSEAARFLAGEIQIEP